MTASVSQAPLSFRSVSFSYSDNVVLRDLTLQARAGEVLGFLGVNGAGKTTTFKLATGLCRPASGEVRIFSQNPCQGKAWAERTGVLFSGLGLYPRLSAVRHIDFFAGLRGLKIDCLEHLKHHGLAEQAKKKAGELSHGFKRRLALACATVHQPELLLLDEPSDGLDPGATEDLHTLLAEYREKGKSVVLTSHRLEEVERICDRIALLSDGVIVASGPASELLAGGDHKNLRELVLDLQRGAK